LDWKRKKWKSPARFFLKLCEYAAVYFPQKTIAISPTIQDYLSTKYKKGIYFVPNGIFRNEIAIADEQGVSKLKNILYVGRIVPEKGIHYLIKAFNDIECDKKLLIVGQPSFSGEYRNYIKSIAGKRVEFLGHVTGLKLKDLYRQAYLFVLPSEIEGMAVSLLEALSWGKCVLVSDIPELVDTVKDCGFYFKNGDYLDLKDRLAYLISNPGVVYASGVKALDLSRRIPDWDKVSQDIENIYKSI
jgi:glycosyltransferase involved in cell wall biosynthesis